VYKFWRISPIEVPIFFAGVFVTVFSTIENGIYTTIATSAALLLYRVFKARGRFLGKVKIHSVIGDNNIVDRDHDKKADYGTITREVTEFNDQTSVRNAFLPIDHADGSNPAIELETPFPGIFIFRFSEGYNYPNANHYLEYLVRYVFEKTQRTNPSTYPRPGVSIRHLHNLINPC
jgi:sodium-independent sulfate anion transporter 11